ncbi:MAG: 7-cyano-7-deazaguanine synthase [Acidimicrobiia bacterium]|nr:7-cyano-7-deazaguanine synthase [Acidimicrobiia bacterium]
MLADPVVVEQPMPIAELDALGDRVHECQTLYLGFPEYCNTIAAPRPMPTRASTIGQMSHAAVTPRQGTGVLLSGGLDSAVLLADEACRGEVHPIYVGAGLAWEAAERATIEAFLHAMRHQPTATRIKPLVVLSVDMRDVYRMEHWAVAGRPPGYNTPDEDVFLPGRNVVLLGKAGVYCAVAGLGRLVLGSLGDNPFPDATPTFREAMAVALSLGLAHPLTIAAPYAEVSKTDVIRRGVALGVPLALTLSCMNPVASSQPASLALHCGVCSKCRERHDAFLDAEVADPTPYADPTFVRQGRSSALKASDQDARRS